MELSKFEIPEQDFAHGFHTRFIINADLTKQGIQDFTHADNIIVKILLKRLC